ncbi:MAG: HAD-IA family hydrolase [Candidatus Heimdallarchaeota archaeon]|nr:HAD-IA family hydrolase [Candidatus Heimdallarchaeota archaeon]
MTTVKGLIFDFDGVISSVMPRFGWPFLQSLKSVKPTIKREAIFNTVNQLTHFMLNHESADPFYALKIMWHFGQVKELNFLQKLQLIIRGAVMYYKNRMFFQLEPGVEELISRLARSYRIGLVTTAERKVITQASQELPIIRNFEVIITRDDCQKTKPHPEGIIKVLEFFNLAPYECLYIGDLPTDIIASRRAKVRVVSVLGHYPHLMKPFIDPFQPDFTISLVRDLPQVLRSINENYDIN